MLMLMLFNGCAVYSAVVPDSPAALAPALPPGWTGAAGVYYTISSGNCAVPVSTRESCEAAAAVLGLSSDETESYEEYYADLTGADRPPFCVSHFQDDGDEFLSFAPGNTGTCTPEEQCICELTPPSAPPSAPSPPASPPLPPLSPGWEKATWNYHMISTGTCGSPVATVSGCEAAAIALGLSDTSPYEGYDYAYDEESGSSDEPPFCHTRGRTKSLYFSSQWNTGDCTPREQCICESTPPSPPMLPSPPSPPLPPSPRASWTRPPTSVYRCPSSPTSCATKPSPRSASSHDTWTCPSDRPSWPSLAAANPRVG